MNRKMKYGVSDFIFKDLQGNIIEEIKMVKEEKDIHTPNSEYKIEFINAIEPSKLLDFYKNNSNEILIEREEKFVDIDTNEENDLVSEYVVTIQDMMTLSVLKEISDYKVIMIVKRYL